MTEYTLQTKTMHHLAILASLAVQNQIRANTNLPNPGGEPITLPPLTEQEWIQTIVDQALQELLQKNEYPMLGLMQKAVLTATDIQKQNLLTILNLPDQYLLLPIEAQIAALSAVGLAVFHTLSDAQKIAVFASLGLE